MNTPLDPFHLALAVDDLAVCEAFYVDIIGCSIGRRSARWVDLNFFGHPLVLHQLDDHPGHPGTQLVGAAAMAGSASGANLVDGNQVPVPHFGLVLSMERWQRLSERLQGLEVEFVIPPQMRFAGDIGEQSTLFLLDPAGNALEFKAFAQPDMLFAYPE